MFMVLSLFMLLNAPVIGPDDVRPSPWFTPVDRAQQEADRQYACRVYLERTGLVADGCTK